MQITTLTKRLSNQLLTASLIVLTLTAGDAVLQKSGMAGFRMVANAAAAEATRRVPAMREQTFKKLSEVAELLSPEKEGVQPNFPAALEELNNVNTSKFNKYELAQVYNYYGWIYYSLERYDDSIKYYKLVVAQSPEISVGLEQQTLKTIAQLYLIVEKYQESINTYKQYMKIASVIAAEDYFTLGQAYYQMNDLNNSLVNVDKAIQMYEEKDRLPKETWYDLQRGLYYEKEDYKKVVEILEKMVVHYNKGKYWLQLAGMYGQVDRNKDQLQAYNTAYVMGALTKERELLNLAYLNLDAEYPYKAAKVIEKGMKDKIIERTSKNLETLATAFRIAQEIKKSIPVMEEAAGKSEDGNLYASLAGTYFQADDYKKAVNAAEQAIKRKGLKRPGDLHLTLGMSLFYLDKYDAAVDSFKEAAKNKGTERAARQWINYAKSEKERKAKLNEA